MSERLVWCVVLGQQSQQAPWSDIALWSGILIGLLLVGGVIAAVVRRMVSPKQEAAADGFTLHGLRQLLARGEITPEEFERAKAAMIERIKGREASAGSSSGGATEEAGRAALNRQKSPEEREDLPDESTRRDEPG